MPSGNQERSPSAPHPHQKLHKNPAIFWILVDQQDIGWIASAADSISSCKKLIRGHFKHLTYDKDLFAYRIRSFPFPVADAALGDPGPLGELLLTHPVFFNKAKIRSDIVMTFPLTETKNYGITYASTQ